MLFAKIKFSWKFPNLQKSACLYKNIAMLISLQANTVSLSSYSSRIWDGRWICAWFGVAYQSSCHTPEADASSQEIAFTSITSLRGLFRIIQSLTGRNWRRRTAVSGSSWQLVLKKGASGDQVWDLLYVQLASYLEGSPLMLMITLHLYVNQKSDYDMIF